MSVLPVESYHTRAKARRVPGNRAGRRGLGSDLSAGQVAVLIGAAPRTVAKWVDKGLMSGAYRLPSTADVVGGQGGDRRIPLASLWAFCAVHGINTDRLPPQRGIVASVGFPEADRLVVPPGYEVLVAADWVDLGFKLRGRQVAAWVIDYGCGRVEGDRAVRWIRLESETTPIARVLPEDVQVEDDLHTTTYRRPFDVDVLAAGLAAAVRA